MVKSSKEYQASRSKRGLCSSCGNAALPNGSRCQTCKDKKAADYQAQKLANQGKALSRYERLKAEGTCPGCASAPKSESSVYCLTCLGKQRARQQAKKAKKRQERVDESATTAAARQKANVCIGCANDQVAGAGRCKSCWAVWLVKSKKMTRHAARKQVGLCQNLSLIHI